MQYDPLVEDVRAALEQGTLDPGELRRLLARTDRRDRPDVAGLLRAAGAILLLFAAASLYGIGFDSYPTAVQAVTPFGFPALVLATTVQLHRRGRARWEVELSGMVGYVALGLAYLASGAAVDGGDGYGMAAGLTATAVVLVMHALVRVVRLTAWGLSASLVAFTTFASDLSGVLSGSTAPWLLAAQAAVAVVTGVALLHRSREAAANALRAAAILGLLASLVGVAHSWSDSIGPWHAALTVVVAATLLAAATLDMPQLMWVGALGAAAWLFVLAIPVGQSVGWVVAVMLCGGGLVGLSALVRRMRSPIRPLRA